MRKLAKDLEHEDKFLLSRRDKGEYQDRVLDISFVIPNGNGRIDVYGVWDDDQFGRLVHGNYPEDFAFEVLELEHND